MMRRRLPFARRLVRDESGFGLVEAVIASGILLFSLFALISTATVGFTDIALARQRQTATSIADQMIETVRGIPYARMKLGLSDTDPNGTALTSDPNVVTCSGVLYFKVCPPDPAAERILHAPNLSASCTSPCVEPPVPHTGTLGPPTYPETFTWSVYLTAAANVPSAGAVRITVIVTWSNAARAGVSNTVQTQSIAHQPLGSVDPSTHVIGSNGGFLYSTASVTPGSIVLTPNTGNVTNGADHLPAWNSATVDLPKEEADVQSEQTQRSTGMVGLLGARLDTGTIASIEEPVSNSVADDDTSTASVGTYNAPTALSQLSGGNLLLSGAAGATPVTLTLSSSGAVANAGSTVSTTAAGTAGVCNAQVNGKPCAYSSITNAHAISEVLDVSSVAPNTGPATLVTTNPADATGATTAYSRRAAGSGGDGIVTGQITRLPGTVALAGLPVPGLTGWNGYWIALANNDKETVSAQAGVGAANPSVSFATSTGIGTPAILAWNGSGYNTIPITAAGGTINLCTPTNNGANNNCQQAYGTNYITPYSDCNAPAGGNSSVAYEVDVTGSLSIGSSYTSSTPGAAGTIVDATATAGPPLTGSITYQVKKYGSVNRCGSANPTYEVDLTMTVDLGSVLVHTTYVPNS